MPCSRRILGVLPHIRIEDALLPGDIMKDVYAFPPHVTISRITPELRQSLCKATQQVADNRRKHEVLDQIEKCHTTIAINLPDKLRSDIQIEILCPTMAYVILNRLIDLMRLFEDLPSITEEIRWFLCMNGTDGNLQNHYSLLHTDGLNEVIEDHVYWTKPWGGVRAWVPILFLERFWDKLKGFSQIDGLLGLLTDERTWRKLFDAGNAFIRENAEGFAREHYRDLKTGVGSGGEPTQMRINIGIRQSAEWFFQGLGDAVGETIDNFEHLQKVEPSQNRLFRAMQVFTQSFRLQNLSHRFTFLITCLESLFSTDTSELSYQLASRIAWLLKPTDPAERIEVFEQVKKLYGFRSKIVHGDLYKTESLNENTELLVRYVRQCLNEALRVEAFYSALCAPKDKSDGFRKYLRDLALGAVSIQ